jgi:hypothetical protein
MRLLLIALFLLPMLAIHAFSQVRLSECSPFDDWIELRNDGSTSVNLEGFGLSDGDDDPRWNWHLENGFSSKLPDLTGITYPTSGCVQLSNPWFGSMSFRRLTFLTIGKCPGTTQRDGTAVQVELGMPTETMPRF